jgi:hypothetical protein
MNSWTCMRCLREWAPWVEGCAICNALALTSATTDATPPDTDELTDEDVIEEMGLYKPHDSELIAKLWRVATMAEAYWGDGGCGNAARLRDALDALYGETSPQPHSVTDEIDSFIANEGKGNVWDALNIALNRLNIAKEVSRIQAERHDADTALAEAVRGLRKGDALCHRSDGNWHIENVAAILAISETPEEALGIAQEVKP